MRLKDNHTASRERISLMTSVTSSHTLAASAANLPLELMCRAKSKQRTRYLAPRRGLDISLTWAEKGSYRKGNIMAYLEQWLDPWDEHRAHRNDWRILLLDVAKSHVGEDVMSLAHSMGICLALSLRLHDRSCSSERH